MWILLASIFLLHLACIALLLAATIHNAWWWVKDSLSTDLWGRWVLIGGNWNFTQIPDNYPREYLQAVQASSVLACVFSVLALIVFVAQLYTLPKGKRFLFTGAFQMLSWICIMIAASIYTEIFHRDEQGQYGASFILSWISVCLTFLSCIIYCTLRKRIRS